MWSSTCTFLGRTPDPLAASLRDDSDADDAVLGISLYHIPDSASLASSASFGFCAFRSIVFSLKLSIGTYASFYYNHDGDDDDDGVRGIG